MSVVVIDPALATLFAPLRDGTLRLPEFGRSLFLRARPTPDLRMFGESLVCEQGFKPHADNLASYVYPTNVARPDERFALVLLLPSRQRDETRSVLIEAAQRVDEHGTIVMAAANNEGARSLQADASDLLGRVQVVSANKCRVIWSLDANRQIDARLVQGWTAAMAPREIPEIAFAAAPSPGIQMLSIPGVFSWDRIDLGSALLARHLPADLAGTGADLGAGGGYLSACMLQRCPQIQALHLYEADRRALQLAQENLRRVAQADPKRFVALDYFWHDVTSGLPQRYDFIVSNPPFHIGRANQPDIGRAFIRAAASALRPGGRLWMVANRHLPYEAELKQVFSEVHKCVEAEGFKVFEAIRGAS